MGCASSVPAADAPSKYAVATVDKGPSIATAVPAPAPAVPISTVQVIIPQQEPVPVAAVPGQGSAVVSSTNQVPGGNTPKATQEQSSTSSPHGSTIDSKPVSGAAPVQSEGGGVGAPGVNLSLKALNADAAGHVQQTLLKVGNLIQKFAEGKTERTTPIQAIRRALDLVVADSHANYASVQVVIENLDAALLVALVGSPEHFLETHRLQRLAPGGALAADMLVHSTGTDYLSWGPADGSTPPSDWLQLVHGAGLRHLLAVPIRVADKLLGILTLGFQETAEHYAEHPLWVTYVQLVAAALSGMVKDATIPKYLALVREVYQAADLDALMHTVVSHMRGVLGHTHNHHTWYRVALTGSSNVAATIFDDLTQVPAPLMQRGLSSQGGSSSTRLLKEVQAAGGVMHTVVAMKSTVMKISVHNRQQVMIPDVQKLINQSGNVSVDIFNTRLIKPPTSVLVFPLKVKQHIFGVVFCMSSVATDFSDVAPRLRELCEVLSPHLQTLLNTTLAADYSMVLAATPTAQEGGSMSGLVMAASRNASFSGRSLGDSGALGLNLNGSFHSQDSFMFTQSRSSTGALVTGLTEKLNQKRIKSSMDFAGNQALTDLQVQALLGEGGFAKVFRGLWRGLVVGIKVVCDDGKNEKMVMKNAHEIAILGALSHPNIVQAYTCLTDVSVRELLGSSFRHTPPTVLNSQVQALMKLQAYQYLAGMEDRSCHIEVIEYCDLGNLSTALKYQVFQVPNPDKVLAAATIINRDGVENGANIVANAATAAAAALLGEARGLAGGRVQMRTLLLTLIEIASAMAYLHRMGVVHCDIKPANVLLRSSNIDSRGFTAKVSDFGLSRVEDDDTHASFPFNSCGTAAYVAPEALICNKKVNSSVDVYAFGILMWEMYTGARPYGNMKQQQLVEEVVMRGLRPRFPSHTPPSYVLLAQACWSGSAQSRPTFEEALSTLNGMLTALDEHEVASSASASFASGDGSTVVEYMTTPSLMTTGGYMNSASPNPMSVAPTIPAAFQVSPGADVATAVRAVQFQTMTAQQLQMAQLQQQHMRPPVIPMGVVGPAAAGLPVEGLNGVSGLNGVNGMNGMSMGMNGMNGMNGMVHAAGQLTNVGMAGGMVGGPRRSVGRSLSEKSGDRHRLAAVSQMTPVHPSPPTLA